MLSVCFELECNLLNSPPQDLSHSFRSEIQGSEGGVTDRMCMNERDGDRNQINYRILGNRIFLCNEEDGSGNGE